MILFSGIFAKALGLCNQILGTYFLAEALGARGLELQMVAISFVSWFSLTLFGMQTSLPALLINTPHEGATRGLYIKSAFITAFFCALAAFVLALSAASIGHSPALSEAPIVAAATCNALLLFVSLSEQVSLANRAIVKFNFLNATGAVLSLAAAFVLSRIHGGANAFIVAYYLSMLLPTGAAGFVIFSDRSIGGLPTFQEFKQSLHRLLSAGGYGLGYNVSIYTKTNLPLLLLDAMSLSNEIVGVGLGLRLSSLLYSGASVFFPILFTRIGAALNNRDRAAYRDWTLIGAGLSLAIAVFVGGACLLFGRQIFEVWTGGAVSLDSAGRLALAIFSASLLAQYMLLSMTAPDVAATAHLRWLFWAEALLAPLIGALGAHWRGGPGLMIGMSCVMISVVLIMLLAIWRRRSGASGHFDKPE